MFSRKECLLVLTCTLLSIFNGISQPSKIPAITDTLSKMPTLPSNKNMNLEHTISDFDYAPPTRAIETVPDIEKPAGPVGGWRSFYSEFINKFIIPDNVDTDERLRFF